MFGQLQSNTKTCPRCHRILDGDRLTCDCGYEYEFTGHVPTEKEPRQIAVGRWATGKICTHQKDGSLVFRPRRGLAISLSVLTGAFFLLSLISSFFFPVPPGRGSFFFVLVMGSATAALVVSALAPAINFLPESQIIVLGRGKSARQIAFREVEYITYHHHRRKWWDRHDSDSISFAMHLRNREQFSLGIVYGWSLEWRAGWLLKWLRETLSCGGHFEVFYSND